VVLAPPPAAELRVCKVCDVVVPYETTLTTILPPAIGLHQPVRGGDLVEGKYPCRLRLVNSCGGLAYEFREGNCAEMDATKLDL